MVAFEGRSRMSWWSVLVSRARNVSTYKTLLWSHCQDFSTSVSFSVSPWLTSSLMSLILVDTTHLTLVARFLLNLMVSKVNIPSLCIDYSTETAASRLPNSFSSCSFDTIVSIVFDCLLLISFRPHMSPSPTCDDPASHFQREIPPSLPILPECGSDQS